MYRTMLRFGSRLHVVGEVVALVLLVKSCAQPAPPPCEECGTGGSAGAETTSEGGDGGSGGETATGGEGGLAVAGGGGAGGAMAGGAGGAAGGAGEGGAAPCVPTFACGPNDCGEVDDGCGVMLDCDAQQWGEPITCATVNGAETGPMACGEDHACHCPAEGNSAEAMALCEGATAKTEVRDWCEAAGGCVTALCGSEAASKMPVGCIASGQALKPGQDPTTWINVWCCSAL